jgi:hypothetical protein
MTKCPKGETHVSKRLLALLIACTPALAQSAWNGTWRLNTNDAQVNVTEKFLLKDGLFSSAAYDPPIKDVKADGQPHLANGAPYYDSLTVRVIDDRTVDYISTKNGKLVDDSKVTISLDNKTATRDDNFVSQSGQHNHETDLWKRLEEGPPGSHKISGSWQPLKIENASDSLRDVTYKVTENGLSMHDGQGDSYDAKFDGKDYPYHGDPGTTSVSLKQIDGSTFEESYKRDGKVITIWRWTVQPDGKTIHLAINNRIHNTTLSFTATKQ